MYRKILSILGSLTTRDTAPRRKERGEEREKREREILKSPTRSCVGRGKLRVKVGGVGKNSVICGISPLSCDCL
jgi:hypothetical protein